MSIDDKREAVRDYITFEYETSLEYPFGIPYEEITDDMVDEIVDECEDIYDTDCIYQACLKVLGTEEDAYEQ